jgi:putative spermidine/putrescine transport system ATP-binding protein
MARLELHDITKRFGDQVAVEGFELSVGDGELVTFLGPSGCGKTTTLRVTAGFERPDRGRVVVDGQDVTGLPANRRGMGMVFQGYALFPNLTAQENIDYGLRVRRHARDERRKRVAEMLELFALGHVADHYPFQLSGGQQQRVAFARAVAIQPSVLLLDEPLSAVDAKVREELRTEIRRMQQRLGITAILVTHDQSEALSISDRVVVMSHGHIAEVGTPAQIYAEPSSEFTASFIGAMNRLRVRVVSPAEGIVERGRARFTVAGASEMPAGGEALMLVRPEALEPLPAGEVGGGAALQGRVEVQTFLGSTTRLLIREGDPAAQEAVAVHGQELIAVDVPSASASRWPSGTAIRIGVPDGSARVIAADQGAAADGAPGSTTQRPGSAASAPGGASG